MQDQTFKCDPRSASALPPQEWPEASVRRDTSDRPREEESSHKPRMHERFVLRVLAKYRDRLALEDLDLDFSDVCELIEDEDPPEEQEYVVLVQKVLYLYYEEEIRLTFSSNVNFAFERVGSAIENGFNHLRRLPMTPEQIQPGLSAFDLPEEELSAYLSEFRWPLPLSYPTPPLIHPTVDTFAEMIVGFLRFVKNRMGASFCTNFVIQARYGTATEASQWPRLLPSVDGQFIVAPDGGSWVDFFAQMSSQAVEPPFVCLVELDTSTSDDICASYYHVTPAKRSDFPSNNFAPYLVNESQHSLIWLCGTRDPDDNVEAYVTFGGRRFRARNGRQMLQIMDCCGYRVNGQTRQNVEANSVSLSPGPEMEERLNAFLGKILTNAPRVVDCAGAGILYERFADMAEMHEQKVYDQGYIVTLSQVRFVERVNALRIWNFQDSSKDQTVTNSFWNYLFRIRWGDVSVDCFPRSVARYPDMTSIIFIAEQFMEFVKGGLAGLPFFNVLIRTQFEGFEAQLKWEEWSRNSDFESIGNLRQQFAASWVYLFLSLAQRADCRAPFVCLMDIGGDSVLSGDIRIHFVTPEEFGNFHAIGQSAQIGMAKATRANFVWLYGVNDAPGTPHALFRAYLGYGGKRQRLRSGKQLVTMMKRFGRREIRHSAWNRNFTMDVDDLEEFSVEIFFGEPQAKSVGGHT